MAPALVTLWLLTTIVAGFVVFLCVRQKVLSKFSLFNCYFAASIVATIGRFWIESGDGQRFFKYMNFYYYSEAVLTILLALAIWQIATRLVAGRIGRRAVLIAGASILLLAILFGFFGVSYSSSRQFTLFVVVISQNIFFVAGLATLILWIRNLMNKAEDRITTQFVNVLVVYFAVFYLLYWLGHTWPYSRAHSGDLLLMMGAWLPLGCSFALVQDTPNAK
jgi:hypothetical protein